MTRSSSKLIDELIGDPRGFNDRGKAYDLLKEFFAGLPVETLRPLLRNENVWVQRSAGFVAAELGKQAAVLVDDVLSLLSSPDPHVQNSAMEVLTVCSDRENAYRFAHVVEKLESEHSGIRLQAMDFVANSSAAQIEAARNYLNRSAETARKHDRGLGTLLLGEHAGTRTIASMLRDADALVRRYGAIAAARVSRVLPDLMAEASTSADADVRQFVAGREGD